MWERSALGKFFIAPAMVRLLAERRNHPLADIAAQMQNEVADTDGFRIGPEPDRFFRKLGQTLSQTRQGFFEQPVPALPDEKLCYFLIEVRHILTLAAVFGNVVCYSVLDQTRMRLGHQVDVPLAGAGPIDVIAVPECRTP